MTCQIIDADGKPLIGQNVNVKGTNIATYTDFNRDFCLVIPETKIIFIELLFCFNQIVCVVEPIENDIEIKIIKEKQEKRCENMKK